MFLYIVDFWFEMDIFKQSTSNYLHLDSFIETT